MKLLLLSLLSIVNYFRSVGGDWLVPRKPGDVSEVEIQNIPVSGLSEERNDRPPLFHTSEEHESSNLPGIDRYKIERAHGSIADLFASNRHYTYPKVYEDLGRRQQGELIDNLFNSKCLVLTQKHFEAVNDQEKVDISLVPKKASPEFVLAVAKKSMKEQAALAAQGIFPAQDNVPKQALRSGDYWDSVYVENVDPNKLLRTENSGLKHQKKRRKPQELHTIKAKVLPDSEIYDLISILTKVSPRLVYVVSNKNRE